MEKYEQISHKKILIPLFEDYYLFKYLYALASRLVERDYHVVIMVGSSHTSDIVRCMSPEVEVRRFPRLITFLNNRGQLVKALNSLWVLINSAFMFLMIGDVEYFSFNNEYPYGGKSLHITPWPNFLRSLDLDSNHCNHLKSITLNTSKCWVINEKHIK